MQGQMNPKEKIFFDPHATVYLQEVIQQFIAANRKIFLLTDANTEIHCIPLFRKIAGNHFGQIIHITIPAGESHKNLENITLIWQKLTEGDAGRDAMLINLGGGVVTDMGGFAASCFKRGIATIHIPTTLLAMVDAAIGGKTGIDFNYLKNHIGSFYQAEGVLIIPEFLSSLPLYELKSGLGEILKYSLISQPDLLKKIPSPENIRQIPHALIEQCAAAKRAITLADPTETGLRKVLNFGHTIGHALESFALENGQTLLHGEAVAAGMIAELWISTKECGLSETVLKHYQTIYNSYFDPFLFSIQEIPAIIKRMYHDKKNAGKSIRFVLLKEAGKAIYDIEVDEETIIQSLNFYLASTSAP